MGRAVASFGEKLRRAREARNLSLQEIASSTKVSTRALQALEEERFEVLPGGIFNKGFVRAYARCVGLDEEKTIAEYMAAANPQPVELDTQAMSEQVTPPKRHPRGLSAVTVVGVVAVLVAAVLAGLWLREQRREAAAEQEAQRRRAEVARLQEETPATVIPPAAPSASTPDTAATPTTTSGANTAAAPATSSELPPQKVAPPAKPAESTPAPVTSTPTHAATAEAEGPAPVEISIAAKERAWISVRSDGKPVETVTLDPDKPELRIRSYKAQERLLLIIGNPAGVTVTYNGKPAGVLGEEGSRAMITFTPEGIEKR